jgi:hypothetical protein
MQTTTTTTTITTLKIRTTISVLSTTTQAPAK